VLGPNALDMRGSLARRNQISRGSRGIEREITRYRDHQTKRQGKNETMAHKPS